ncbi:NAD(P)/FAD-dependent oxidoreductase [Streptomyces brasiliensis]|uniref:Pyridine nucleotide-disulfide oxidoreductase n=1 Tax=Streptomyces brasiliensis TaxID=1954 RepID=A0A917P7N0_9ACTN|nr:FAD-dependent oxidoreductase [Streptomyces brasiliensis]GGJ65684.1 pyridine nucleotide-disulfide oxidoreductase [Streptomyces brasiliensis]
MVEKRDVVIVGGSVAATRAAEAVHRHAPHLSVTMVSDETHPPHERPPLSKVGLNEPLEIETLTYPTVETLRDGGVEIRLGTRAQSLDPARRLLGTTSGAIEYGAIVIATGCEPILPPQFADQPDVFILRRYDDAVALRHAVADPSRTVALVGAGFIGGEFAATLVKEGREVAIIDLAEKPLGRFGDNVADAYIALHRDAGVNLHLGSAVVGTATTDGRRHVRLDDGSQIPADVIVVGVGVRPSVDWLAESGLPLDNGIVCDETLRAIDGVFAAGDVVRWPNERFGASMRVEHWTNAAEQGRVAAINAVASILGEPLTVCANVPYFWSDQHGVRIQFAGHRYGDEQVLERHNEDGKLFVFQRGDAVTGVLAFERRQHFARLRAALRNELDLQQADSILGVVGEGSQVAVRS